MKRHYIFITIVIVAFLQACDSKKQSSANYENRVNVESIVDYKIVIAPSFHLVRNFGDGLAPAKETLNGKWGYIDKQGKTVLPFDFNEAFPFKGGFAWVKKEDKRGIINTNGEFVLESNEPDVVIANYSEGMIAYRNKNENSGLWGFIDINGIIVISPQFQEVSLFSEDLAAAKMEVNGKLEWGYIDKKGKVKIKPNFSHAGVFKEGLAYFATKVQDVGDYGFINKNGDVVIQPEFIKALPFNDGLAVVQSNKTRLWGAIDKSGKFIIEPRFHAMGNFSNGLAPVKITEEKNAKWGFINKKGELIIKPEFDSAYSFVDEMAAISYGSDIFSAQWGFIKLQIR